MPASRHAASRPRPPRFFPLDGDPDARTLRWLWLLWAALTVVFAIALTLAPVRHSADAIAWLQRAPLVALWVLLPLWQGARVLLGHLRQAPLAPWQGRYYAFDDHQIRVLVDEQGELFIVAADVFDALRVQGRSRHPDRVRACAGPEGLRQLPGIPQPVFTEVGLQKWLEKTTRRDAQRFSHWLKTQVSGPQHRK